MVVVAIDGGTIGLELPDHNQLGLNLSAQVQLCLDLPDCHLLGRILLDLWPGRHKIASMKKNKFWWVYGRLATSCDSPKMSRLDERSSVPKDVPSLMRDGR